MQYVVQYVRAKENLYTDKELPLYITDDGKELKFEQLKEVADGDQAEVNCGFCKKVISAIEGKWYNPVNQSGTQYCPKCYTQYHIRRRLEKKTKMHSYYERFDMPQREETKPKGDYSKP